MPVRDNLTKVLKDLILPELQGIRGEVSKLGTRLDVVETRLADFSARFQAIDQHLVDQSRRIDESRTEVTARIDQQTARIDQLSTRMDDLRAELSGRIDQQNVRIDQLMAQQATILHEVAALRQDREVVGDLVRRVSRLEAHAA